MRKTGKRKKDMERDNDIYIERMIGNERSKEK